jgi:hypothetical protein
MSFATFHMGRHGKSLRIMCFFVHDLLVLPGNEFAMHHPELYVALMHFMSNIDALGGEDQVVDLDELPPELYSASLAATLKSFLTVLPRGILDSWHERFYNVDADALVAQDVKTFSDIDSIFIEIKKGASSPGATAKPRTLLGDLPAVKKQDRSASIEETKLVKPPTKAAAPSKAANNISSKLRCALNGHVLKNPIISPFGDVFEKDTITSWLSQNGAICPLSGKPLQLSDLKPAPEIQKEVMQYHIQEVMKMNNPENEVDLYDF